MLDRIDEDLPTIRAAIRREQRPCEVGQVAVQRGGMFGREVRREVPKNRESDIPHRLFNRREVESHGLVFNIHRQQRHRRHRRVCQRNFNILSDTAAQSMEIAHACGNCPVHAAVCRSQRNGRKARGTATQRSGKMNVGIHAADRVDHAFPAGYVALRAL